MRRAIQGPFEHLQSRRRECTQRRLITAYKKNPNLKYTLVRAALLSPPSNLLRAFFLKKKIVCNQQTLAHFPIIQDFDPSTKNLVYVISCLHCHLLYVGQTKNSLKDCLQHLGHINKSLRHTPLYDHFSSVGVDQLTQPT